MTLAEALSRLARADWALKVAVGRRHGVARARRAQQLAMADVLRAERRGKRRAAWPTGR